MASEKVICKDIHCSVPYYAFSDPLCHLTLQEAFSCLVESGGPRDLLSVAQATEFLVSTGNAIMLGDAIVWNPFNLE
jgi:hypothetical protein